MDRPLSLLGSAADPTLSTGSEGEGVEDGLGRLGEVGHAVMEDGRIVEEGSIVDIFTHPQAKMTKSFIASTSTTDRIYDLIEEGHTLTELGEDEVIVSLKYDASNATQALISEISRTYDVDCNIIFGNIEVVKDTPIGTLIVVLKGDPEKRKAESARRGRVSFP